MAINHQNYLATLHHHKAAECRMPDMIDHGGVTSSTKVMGWGK
jgi:hypothetical protein